jgi:hypothetical protein
MGGGGKGFDSGSRTGARNEDKDALQAKIEKNSQKYEATGLFGRKEMRTPVLDAQGNPTGGYLTDSKIFGPGNAFIDMVTKALGIPTPQVYTGPAEFDPGSYGKDYEKSMQDKSNSDPVFNSALINQQNKKLQAALKRANAISQKRKELADAFGFFNDDFYDDMGTSFSDFQQSSLQEGYDGSLRGIMEGFKAQGMLRQADVDEAVGKLDSAKQSEMEKITQGATDYSQAKRDEVAAKQAKLGDQLSALSGGAKDVAQLEAQTAAIQNFDFNKEIEKLKTPGKKTGMDFFTDFTQLAAPIGPSINVQAESTAGAPQFGEITPITTGIRSPFDSRSIRVV